MQPYEIIAGPATLWLAPVGTAFPLIGAAPAVAWTKVGTTGDKNYSADGVMVTHNQSIDQARPLGTTGPTKAWRTSEDLMVGLTLWDMTLEQYATVLNGNTISTTAAGTGSAGFKKIGLSQGEAVTAYALLVRGLSAYGDAYAAQYEVPRCYQSASPKPVFKKGTPAALELQFTALEDLAAASADQRFGRLIQQHAAALP